MHDQLTSTTRFCLYMPVWIAAQYIRQDTINLTDKFKLQCHHHHLPSRVRPYWTCVGLAAVPNALIQFPEWHQQNYLNMILHISPQQKVHGCDIRRMRSQEIRISTWHDTKGSVKSSVTNITTEADINLLSTIHVEKIVETKIRKGEAI